MTGLYRSELNKDKTIRIHEGLWHQLIDESQESVDMVFGEMVEWLCSRGNLCVGIWKAKSLSPNSSLWIMPEISTTMAATVDCHLKHPTSLFPVSQLTTASANSFPYSSYPPWKLSVPSTSSGKSQLDRHATATATHAWCA
ncbi:caffeoylshikimate esterase-like [Pyrus ussuriensis x Pyrus communis]|uniref:Caffeoylshikimate esterase-like n=1 Tax=Pyrus ussuriensis x Pyrus communis TaxID=2448454 RepID=A0A5N5F7S3_9ROSA|nr:caffeoylshikimate esterase-like [Pyrus ussuriensis x Pyrus communis]